MPTLEDWQHWTLVMGRAQQMLMEFWAENLKTDQPFPAWSPGAFGFAGGDGAGADPMALMSAGAEAWAKGLEAWGKVLAGAVPVAGGEAKEAKDRRFAAPEWRENPIFDTIRKSYLQISDRLLGTVDEIENVDPATREKLRFTTRALRRCDEPVELRADQPAGAQADARNPWRESAQGPVEHAARHRRGAAYANQARRVRGRPKSRDHAGQGDQARRRSIS